MTRILELTVPCVVCKGTKVQDTYDVNGNINGNKPCESCGATGVAIAQKTDITDLMDELDYIHGKVKAIWNQVKPGP